MGLLDARGCLAPPSFDADWRPEAYLAEYYCAVEQDEQVTLAFLVEAAGRIGEVPCLLEFGCGPTVHHALPFAATAQRLDLADYLVPNLEVVAAWLRDDGRAFDWSPFAAATLAHELGRPASAAEVDERLALTRDRIGWLLRADARRRPALPSPVRSEGYPAVVSCFCADSITADASEWRDATLNIAALVGPGGWFVVTALAHARHYRVGDLRFRSAAVDPAQVAEVLHVAGFDSSRTEVELVRFADDRGYGFDSVVLALARRPG